MVIHDDGEREDLELEELKACVMPLSQPFHWPTPSIAEGSISTTAAAMMGDTPVSSSTSASDGSMPSALQAAAATTTAAPAPAPAPAPADPAPADPAAAAALVVSAEEQAKRNCKRMSTWCLQQFKAGLLNLNGNNHQHKLKADQIAKTFDPGLSGATVLQILRRARYEQNRANKAKDVSTSIAKTFGGGGNFPTAKEQKTRLHPQLALALTEQQTGTSGAETTRQSPRSQFIGVNWSKRDSKWRVTIWNEGRNQQTVVGYFALEQAEAAARAYDTAARQLRGLAAHSSRCKLNFPTADEETDRMQGTEPSKDVAEETDAPQAMDEDEDPEAAPIAEDAQSQQNNGDDAAPLDTASPSAASAASPSAQ
eukprot:COSAG06_NODE_7362_length_2528_cov_1.234253_1_plen_367_part_10